MSNIICRECKSTNILSYPTATPDQAICADCCGKSEHPDGETSHQYERCDGDWSCKYCGMMAPHQWIMDFYSE